MTREEAKINLNMIRVAFVDPGTKEQRELVDDTFEMAIQALSQEPTVTSTDEPMTMVYPTIFCEDAISRESVQEAFADYVASGFAESVADFEAYTDIVMTLPSVTPSRRN